MAGMLCSSDCLGLVFANTHEHLCTCPWLEITKLRWGLEFYRIFVDYICLLLIANIGILVWVQWYLSPLLQPQIKIYWSKKIGFKYVWVPPPCTTSPAKSTFSLIFQNQCISTEPWSGVLISWRRSVSSCEQILVSTILTLSPLRREAFLIWKWITL